MSETPRWCWGLWHPKMGQVTMLRRAGPRPEPIEGREWIPLVEAKEPPGTPPEEKRSTP